MTMITRARQKRSMVKAITYRGNIICLDCLVAWSGIKWGLNPQAGN